MFKMYGNIQSWILFQWVFYSGVSMEITSDLYTKIAGSDLRGASYLDVCQLVDRVRCAQRCSQSSECRSFSYMPVEKHCFLFDKRIHDFGTYLEKNEAFDYYTEVQDTVTDGDWELVFRGESGNGVKISDKWTSSSADDPRSINPDCYSILKLRPCGNHFKTKKMFFWSFSPIQKVKLVFYKSLDKVVEMVFNGVDSSVNDWFSKDRLLTSNWDDLKMADTAFFSIDGQNNRKFYTTTTNNLLGCESNYGWTAVINAEQNYCDFDKRYEEPAFLYSSSKNKAKFETDASEADVMAVFISLV